MNIKDVVRKHLSTELSVSPMDISVLYMPFDSIVHLGKADLFRDNRMYKEIYFGINNGIYFVKHIH